MLVVSTDPLGQVSVHWGQVAGLESPRELEVQLTSGAQYQGSLRTGPPDQLIVTPGSSAPATLALSDVIRLAPIGNQLWNRVDGSLDAGFSLVQANSETHATVNATTSYRSSRYQFTTTFASQVPTRDDADRVFRCDLNLSGNRYFSKRWYTIGWGAFQQNDELSLDLRMVGGGGVGREFVHTNRRLWSSYAGVAYTHEQFFEEPSAQSAEVAIGGQLDFFSPQNDHLSITNRVVSYFNLGGRARVRLELQSAWRYEFLKDFYWSINGFESFDGDPPADQKENDAGVSVRLGYKF